MKLQIVPDLAEEDLTHEVCRGIGMRRNIVVTLLVLEGFGELAAGSWAMEFPYRSLLGALL